MRHFRIGDRFIRRFRIAEPMAISDSGIVRELMRKKNAA